VSGLRLQYNLDSRPIWKKVWSNEMKQTCGEVLLDLVSSIDAVPDLQKVERPQAHVNGSLSGTIDTQQRYRFNGIVIGTLVNLKNSATPLVDFPCNPGGPQVQACCTVALSAKDVGRKVALMFEGGDPRKPIVIGLIQHPEESQPDFPGIISNEPQNPLEVQVDGERLVLTAQHEIVLRCGKASITLTRSGKVLIHGEYLLSRASGVNRIKGGSVQIN
jgi:hypothetical protein